MADTSFGRLLVRLGIDRSEFDKGLAGTERAIGQLGTRLQGAGRGLSVALTAPILAVGAAALKTAADVEEMRGAFQAVFKDSSASVRQFAEDTGKALNRSKFDLEGFLTTFQDTFVPLGFARKEAAELSKVMTTLAVDIAAF